VSKQEVDRYLAAVDEPGRSTLGALRQTIAELIPDAEECISYGMPGFRLQGKMVAGYAAYKNHLSYFPHSGSVIHELAGDLTKYETNAGTLRFPLDKPLPKRLVKKLVDVRIRQALKKQ
jgi:uncharacterized protein YdhG (YjbR/CyaY superfamily)